MHFGRQGAAEERAREAALIECLRHHEDEVTHLYLVGDVFDAYIEYPGLVPRGFARLKGLLATWTDRGIDVTYLAGNHDPWHLGYFQEELGVRFVEETTVEPLYGRHVYLAHGDQFVPSARRYRRLRPLLRHPLAVGLYRLLPGDAAFRLARWVSRRYSTEAIDHQKVGELEAHARTVLQRPDVDLVVMGHVHQPALHVWDDGTYLNPGAWFETQTYGVLDEDGIKLLRWNDPRPRVVSFATAAHAA